MQEVYFGEVQHGHLEQVGYDTYCRLLDEVVKEMQGKQLVQDEKDIQIDLNISSYIPEEFINNSSQKIEIYQNIALCRTEQDIQDVIDEIIDRYGRIPKEVENLIEIIRIKELCRKNNINKVSQNKNTLIFYFTAKEFDINLVDKLIKIYANKIKFSPSRNPYISFKLDKVSEQQVINKTKEFLQNLL